jgi:hypothetical protein
MKECIECGKKLGIIEGYRHPILGKNYLLCRNCFDIIFESTEKYQEFVSTYIGFFKNESSTIDDFQNIGKNITKNIKKMQDKFNNLWFNKTNQNSNEFFSNIR